jgi:hypothetical protein
VKAVILSLLFFSVATIAQEDVRFESIEIYLSSPAPVAAWQFELADSNGAMKVVGVENGQSDAFAGTPYYDREAVQMGAADRIVVADFSLAGDAELPSGDFRVATLHLMLNGAEDPEFTLTLVTATTHDGKAIDASISLRRRGGTE